MKLPSFIYRSDRVGKGGKIFSAYKIRTLKEGIDKTSSFAQEDQYLRFGKFLRKYKLDELPQVFNILKGEMSLVGPRPEEVRAINLLPTEIKEILTSVRPGLTSLSSIHFFDEERLLQQSGDLHRAYWTEVKPLKIFLDVFYVQHRSWLLDLTVLWLTLKRIIKELFKRDEGA